MGVGLVDLWEMSPVRFEDNDSHTEAIVDMLFPGNPLLCCGKSKSEFATRPREDVAGRAGGNAAHRALADDGSRTGRTQDGKESEHTLENTGPRRFLVIEQDQGTIDEQAAILLHLAERSADGAGRPFGSKSLHGWLFCQGRSEERLQEFMRYAVTLGADRAMWTRSQFVRMPDGTREGGNRQTVYFFNPERVK